MSVDDLNFLLLTYDSCRYDVLAAAQTPVLDSFARIVPAQTPASYTYAAHMSFFVGILPNASEDLPTTIGSRNSCSGCRESVKVRSSSTRSSRWTPTRISWPASP